MQYFQGKSVYKGIVMGPVAVLKKNDYQVKRARIEDPEAEVKRVKEAVEVSKKQLGRLYDKAVREVGEASAAIFEVHQMMLEDEDYLESMENMIRTELVNAEYAAAATGDNFAEMFAAMDDEYMKARSADVKDISERLVRNLSGEGDNDLSSMEPSVIVADDLSPSETVQMDKEKILAFVTVHGSTNSHTAILARMMNIPALIGVPMDLNGLKTGMTAVVDGFSGQVIFEPEEDVRRFRRPPKVEPPPPDTPPQELARTYGKGLKGLRTRALLLFLLAALALAQLIVPSVGLVWLPPLDGAQVQSWIAVGLLGAGALLSLDVLGTGIGRAFRGKVEMDTLAALACLFTLADGILLALEPGEKLRLPYTAVVLADLFLLLHGRYHKRCAQRLSCRVAAASSSPYRVTQDEGKWNGRDAYTKWSGTAEGFGSQIQMDDGAQRIFHRVCPLLLLMWCWPCWPPWAPDILKIWPGACRRCSAPPPLSAAVWPTAGPSISWPAA